ncbi:MAG: helix-turn-helix domain-containing protein [Nitrososphaerales archaeon]
MVYEVALQLEHDCPYNNFSRRLPDLVVMHWCSQNRDVLQIHGDNLGHVMSLDREIDVLENSLGAKLIRDEFVTPDVRVIVHMHQYAKMKRNINAIIDKCNCVEIQPTVYKNGAEWYRILAVDNKDLIKLFRALSSSTDYNILSRTNLPAGPISPNFTIQMSELLGQLTPRQLAVLELALIHGYYKTPRKVKAADLAKISKVPRTSFEDHRRKAECKVMNNLLPYVNLFRANSRRSTKN